MVLYVFYLCIYVQTLSLDFLQDVGRETVLQFEVFHLDVCAVFYVIGRHAHFVVVVDNGDCRNRRIGIGFRPSVEDVDTTVG